MDADNWTIELPKSNVDANGWMIEKPASTLATSLSSDKPTYLSNVPQKTKSLEIAGGDPDSVAFASGAGFFDMVKEIFPESPFAEKASAQNAIQVARELGVSPSLVDKKTMQLYAEKKGAYTQPESKEFLTKLMLAPVAAGLMTHPVATLAGLATFGGLAEAENFAVSKVKKEPYQFGAGKGLADLTEEGTSEGVKDVLWLTDLTWQALAAGGVAKGAKAGADKFAETFLRDVVTKYNMPRTVFISPEKIREFHGMGREDVISPAETDMLKDLGMTRKDYVDAVKYGIDIELPVEKLVTVQDKPWVKGVKQFFKITPYEVSKTETGTMTARRPVSGLIEGESTPERTFSDIMNDMKGLFSDALGSERGSFSLKDLSPEKQAQMDRLKADFDLMKKKASDAGQDVSAYMKEKGFDENIISHMSTAFNLKTGDYLDEKGDIRLGKDRESLLYKEAFGNIQPVEDGEMPFLVLTGGPPGGGKSTSLKAMGIEKGKFVRSDADQIKEMAGYDDMAAKFHEESSRLNKDIANKAINENYHLLYDSLLSNFKLADDLISRTLNKGGGVKIAFTNVDYLTSIVRARARFEKGETKREIPEDASLKGHNRSLPDFIELYKKYGDNPNVSFALVDNNVDGGDAKLVFVKEGSETVINDQALFDKLMKIEYIEREGGKYYERSNPATSADVESQRAKIRERLFQSLHKRSANSGAGLQRSATKPAAATEEITDTDDINALLSMAARTDQATGANVLGENPSYDAIRQKAARLAFEKIQKKIDFQKRKEASALKRQGESDARLLPVFQAMDHIVKSGGISKKSLEADYDKDTIKELVRKRPGIVTENGTMGIDVYADQHGFESGDDLLNAILDWRGIKEEGRGAADDFLQNYGELISKAEANNFHIDLLQEEEKILAQLLKGNAPKPATGLKQFIRQETGQIRVDELVVSEYEALTAAMKKAEQASRKAFSEGKIDGALSEKTRQREIAERLNARLEAKTESRDIHDGIIKIMKDDSIPSDYKDRIEDFLSDYDLYPRSKRTRERVESTREFLERMETQGEDVNVPQSLLNKIERYGRTHWRDLTLDQLRDIYDQTKMLAHLGKLKSKLLAQKEARDYEAVVSGIVDNIKKNWPGVNAEPTPEEIETMLLPPTYREQAMDMASGYAAEITKPEYIFRRLDRWQELGPAWESFYKPIQDAYNTEMIGLKPITEKLEVIFKSFNGKWAREKYKIPGVPQILTKEKMVMVALNTGNEGNLNALRQGLKWDDAQIKAITDKLTPEEWELVSDIWGIYKEQFPALADVYKKLNGTDLVPVDGDYHPLVFDRTLSWIADKNAAEAEMRDFFQTIYTKPKVTTGAVIERKGGTLPPKLSFDVIFKHLADVNHYISHVLPVRDVQRLLSDPRIRSAIETAPRGIGGVGSYSQLIPWLQNIAKPKVDPLSLTESFLQTIRRNTTTVALGLKFSVAAFQWLGSTQSIEAVGHNRFVKGLLDFYTHRGEMVEAIKAKSPEIANRSATWDRELNDAYGRLGLENFKGSQTIKDAYFSLISLMDMAVAYPTWQAAFDKGMKEFNGDESKAIYFADMKVRNSQGNALPKDLAGIQRGTELKKFVTMFYTFFSAMENQLAEVNKKFHHGEKNVYELVKSWWWIVVVPALLGYMMKERKVPGPIEAGKEVIQYGLGGYPVLRDIASPVFSDFDYQFSPAARFGEVAGKAIDETLKLPTEDRDVEKFARYSFESAGYIAGIPTGQALITIKGFNDLKNGETSDVTRLLMRGPKEDDE